MMPQYIDKLCVSRSYIALAIFLICIEKSHPLSHEQLQIPEGSEVISPDNSTRYVIVEDEISWQDSKKTCETWGGKLLEVRSEKEYDLWKPIIIEYGSCLWIGLNDIHTEGDYRWQDGSVAGFVPIIDGYFSFATRWYFDCIAFCETISSIPDTYWSPDECDTHWGFICQLGAIETTTKATIVPSKPMVKTRKPKNEEERRIIQLMEFKGFKILSKPDMVKKAYLSTHCARECLRWLSPCAIFNFNSATGQCLGFLSAEVLQREKQTEEYWTVWENGFDET